MLDLPLFPIIFRSPTRDFEVLKKKYLIPGTRLDRGAIHATPDAAIVLRGMGLTEIGNLSKPVKPSKRGIEELRSLNIPFRPHQRLAVKDLATHPHRLLKFPTRTGKSLALIGAAIATGAERICVVTLGSILSTWAREIHRWTGDSAVLLKGRGGSCIVTDPHDSFRILKARRLRSLEGLSNLGRHRFSPIPDGSSRQFYCTEHPEYRSASPGDCEACRSEILDRVRSSRWIVTNYEVLADQVDSNAFGREIIRDDLPGWVPFLRSLRDPPFDVLIIDEPNRRLRTWRTKESHSIYERLFELRTGIPYCWLATATPSGGLRRHYLPMFDLMTDGVWSYQAKGSNRRSLFGAEARYCDGQHRSIEYGPTGKQWWADGRSRNAEWKIRRDALILERSRSEIDPDMPKTEYSVNWIDIDPADAQKACKLSKVDGSKGLNSKLAIFMRRTLAIKASAIVESVLTDLLAGEKTLVYCKLKSSVAFLGKIFEREIRGKMSRNRKDLERLGCLYHEITGSTSQQARDRASQAFTHHSGPALWLSTIDAVPGGIRLAGAWVVHLVELHSDVDAIQQAIERPLEKGARGIAVIVHTVRGTYDEHAIDILLPKLKALMMDEADRESEDMQAVMDARPKELSEKLFARMAAYETQSMPWEE